MDVFVYYRVQECDVQRLLPSVARLLDRARDEMKLTAKLMRRPDVDDGHQTWMEIYRDVPIGFDSWFASACDAHELSSIGTRHIEHFIDLPDECSPDRSPPTDG